MSAQGALPLQHQSLGGIPTDDPDVWVNAFFVIVFTICAAVHSALLKWSTSRNRKFAFSTATIGTLLKDMASALVC